MVEKHQTSFVKFWTVPKLYPNGTVYIIGGGPSLREMDWAPLHDKRVIGCNDAYTLGNWVDICFFCDHAWFDGTKNFPGHKRLGLFDYTGLKVSCPEHPIFDRRVKVLRRIESHQGIMREPDRLCWNLNTGGTAINLAVHLGVRRIVLLGFDMQLSPEGKSNWHDMNKCSANASVYHKFLKTFTAVKLEMDKWFPNVEVINTTPNSKLELFPFADLKDVLENDKPGGVVATKTEPTRTIPVVPKISVLCPTRGRPKMCNRFVKSLMDTASRKDALEIILYVDHDDPDMAQYRKWINVDRCILIVGKLAQEGGDAVGKAWNLMAKECTGDLLMMGNDDLVMQTRDWDVMLRQQAERFEDGIVMMWFDDLIHGEKQCTFPIVTRKWYETLGYFVPEHFMFFCHDTWLWDLSKKVERGVFIKRGILEHRHFSTGKMEKDDTTHRNRTCEQSRKDVALFHMLDAERCVDAEKLNAAKNWMPRNVWMQRSSTPQRRSRAHNGRDTSKIV